MDRGKHTDLWNQRLRLTASDPTGMLIRSSHRNGSLSGTHTAQSITAYVAGSWMLGTSNFLLPYSSFVAIFFANLAHVRDSHQYYVGKILTVSYGPLFPKIYKLLIAALNLQSWLVTETCPKSNTSWLVTVSLKGLLSIPLQKLSDNWLHGYRTLLYLY